MENDQIQEAILTLIEASGHWNSFCGPAIARDLRQNRKFWMSAIFAGPAEQIYLDSKTGNLIRSEQDFSAHRGLPGTLNGFDVLQLTPCIGSESELEELAWSWNPDSVEWIGLPDAATAIEDAEAFEKSGGDPDRVILHVWWD